MLSRGDRTSAQPGPAQRPGLSKCGAVVGVGTLCLVIGAGGEGDGFCRIARPTCIPGAGVPTMVGETPTMVGKAATVPTMTGTPSGVPIEVGEVPPVAGVIHSQSQRGLTPAISVEASFSTSEVEPRRTDPKQSSGSPSAVSGVLRVRLRVWVICCARVTIP
jgi:hypothetical protein